jgi:hypothetical protein
VARERWRNVRRARGYKVSYSTGQVRSVDRQLADGRAAGGIPLEQFEDDDGYLRVTIHGESVPVHILVLEAFHGPRPFGKEGCHGPGGQKDNSAENLRWDTHQENEKDKIRERKREKDRSGIVVSSPYSVVTPVTGDVR